MQTYCTRLLSVLTQQPYQLVTSKDEIITSTKAIRWLFMQTYTRAINTNSCSFHVVRFEHFFSNALECNSSKERPFNMEMPLPGCVQMDPCIAMNFRIKKHIHTTNEETSKCSIAVCTALYKNLSDFMCAMLCCEPYESAFWKSPRFITVHNENAN